MEKGRREGDQIMSTPVCVASIDARLVARPGMEQGVLGRAARRASTRSGGLVQQWVRHRPGGWETAHPCAFRAARAHELRVALSRGIHAARAARPGVLEVVRGAVGRRQKARWRAGASCAVRRCSCKRQPRASRRRARGWAILRGKCF